MRIPYFLSACCGIAFLIHYIWSYFSFQYYHWYLKISINVIDCLALMFYLLIVFYYIIPVFESYILFLLMWRVLVMILSHYFHPKIATILTRLLFPAFHFLIGIICKISVFCKFNCLPIHLPSCSFSNYKSASSLGNFWMEFSCFYQLKSKIILVSIFCLAFL